jgi:FMN-dependent NADH-azoreductase
VQPGYTFSYSPESGYTGLVTGKPITVVYARGGQYPAGTDAEAMDLQSKYMKLILGFIGFTDIRELMVEPTLMEGPDTAKQKKEEALNKAREMAKEF